MRSGICTVCKAYSTVGTTQPISLMPCCLPSSCSPADFASIPVCLEWRCTPPCTAGCFRPSASFFRTTCPLARLQVTVSKSETFVKPALQGIYGLHQHVPQILHCDVKSPNLVCDTHWRVKVTDFNLSRMMDGAASMTASPMANNPRWQAPEVISQQLFTTKSDVFSFGVVRVMLAH